MSTCKSIIHKIKYWICPVSNIVKTNKARKTLFTDTESFYQDKESKSMNVTQLELALFETSNNFLP